MGIQQVSLYVIYRKLCVLYGIESNTTGHRSWQAPYQLDRYVAALMIYYFHADPLHRQQKAVETRMTHKLVSSRIRKDFTGGIMVQISLLVHTSQKFDESS